MSIFSVAAAVEEEVAAPLAAGAAAVGGAELLGVSGSAKLYGRRKGENLLRSLGFRLFVEQHSSLMPRW
jgi:hypothetical protein